MQKESRNKLFKLQNEAARIINLTRYCYDSMSIQQKKKMEDKLMKTVCEMQKLTPYPAELFFPECN